MRSFKNEKSWNHDQGMLKKVFLFVCLILFVKRSSKNGLCLFVLLKVPFFLQPHAVSKTKVCMYSYLAPDLLYVIK